MKVYNWVAIAGFFVFLLGCLIKQDNLGLIGIGMVLLMVPFNINDNFKRKFD